jgi:hypothetical protein
MTHSIPDWNNKIFMIEEKKVTLRSLLRRFAQAIWAKTTKRSLCDDHHFPFLRSLGY